MGRSSSLPSLELLHTGRLAARLARVMLPILLAALAILSVQSPDAWAQEKSGDWSVPENVSKSGGASAPLMVVDAASVTHVVWRDVVDDYVYSKNASGVWTEPTPVTFPFQSFNSQTAAGKLLSNAGLVHLSPGREDALIAFWSDADQGLYFSSVASSQFAETDAWLAPQQVSEVAVAVDASVDRNGAVHLVYLSPAASSEFQSGIYYRRLLSGDREWSSPVLLYESPYFRTASQERFNVEVKTSAEGSVLVGWDNPGIERVFMILSADGGDSWAPPQEVDRREVNDDDRAVGPSGLRLAVEGRNVRRLWQAGHNGLSCVHYEQVSEDGGDSWGPRERIFGDEEGCWDRVELLRSDSGGTLAFLYDATRVHAAILQDGRWEAPQPQPALLGATDPLTFRPVDYDCQQAARLPARGSGSDGQVIAVACDAAGARDIWFRQRPLADLEAELLPTEDSVWRRPEEAFLVASDAENLSLVADADGLLHALWNQPLEQPGSEAIYYSNWAGTEWTPPAPVLTSDRGAFQLQTTVDAGLRLMAVWTDGQPGQPYFARASTSRAAIDTEWSVPLQLPVAGPDASSPAIAADSDQTVYVSYVLPLNEGRGVYLTASTDGGESWSQPAQVFDAVAAGWPMVDGPRIAVGEPGTLHVIYTRYSLPPRAEPSVTLYSRSEDAGLTWSFPQEMIAAGVLWKSVVATGSRDVHITWQDRDGALWHRRSLDAGLNWSRPARLAGLSAESGPAALVLDGAGTPVLIQTSGDPETQGRAMLRQWSWRDERWQEGEPLSIVGSASREVAATIAGANLSVLFNGEATDAPEDSAGRTIMFTERTLELQPVEATPSPAVSPTPTQAPSESPSPAPSPTATIAFPTAADDGSALPLGSSNPIAGPLLGIIPAAVVVLVAFFIGMRILRGSRR